MDTPEFSVVPTRIALAAAMALPLYSQGQESPAPVRTLGTFTVTGGQPTSLPTQIPTTIEGITREQILSARCGRQHRVQRQRQHRGPLVHLAAISDVNGFAFQGASKYFTSDVRVRYQIAKQWSAAFGIDNLNNYQFWNFHPYPQRSYSAELKFDL